MEFSLADSPHFRNLVAIVLGLTVSTIVVGTVEMVGHAVYPPPPGIDLADQEEVAAMMAEAPIPALLFVVAAWMLGIFTGCFIAGVLGHTQGTFCCQVLGLLFVLMAATMLVQIPAPVWFNFASLSLLIPGGFGGWWLSQRLLAYWGSLRSVEEQTGISESTE